jgi:hypothetical protein
MNALAKVCSLVFIGCFVYLMISAYALRWMIDEAKVKDAAATVFRAVTPPRAVLTPLGRKIWISRWIALAAGLLFLGLTFALRQE